MSSLKPMLLCVAPLGPPDTGASIVTERMLDEFEAEWSVQRCNIGPTSRWNPLLIHPMRVLTAVWSGILVLARRPRLAYISLPAGISVLLVTIPLAAARLTGTRVVLHHHSFAYLRHRHSGFAAIFKLAGDATHVALCGRMSRQLTDLYPSIKHIHVVSNAAFVQPAQINSIKNRQGVLRLAHLSNLSVEKGLERVLEATHLLVVEGTATRLRLGGTPSGHEEEVLIKTFKQRLGDNLELMGRINQSDLGEFFDGVDLFVFPSEYRNEAEPLVVLEALAHGVVCLTSTVGCLGEDASLISIDALDARSIVRHVRTWLADNTQVVDYRSRFDDARNSLGELMNVLHAK